MNWADAFRTQAKSDFEVFKLLKHSKDTPRCHQLHYLQMAMEKLAKSFKCPPSGEPPRATHKVLESFLQQCQSNVLMRNAFRFDPSAFRAYLKMLEPIARKIENLAPAINKESANCEYPWMEHGSANCPATHPFSELTESEILRIQQFAFELFRQY